jgi:toxin YoeB
MKLVFTESSWTDYIWFQNNDKKLLKHINGLLKRYKELLLKVQENQSFLEQICQVFGREELILSIGLFIRLLRQRLLSFPLDFIMQKIKHL